MLSLIAAGLLATASPEPVGKEGISCGPPPPTPPACANEPSCRFVGVVVVRDATDDSVVQQRCAWEPAVHDAAVRLYVGEYVILRLEKTPDGRTRLVFIASGPAEDTDIRGLEEDMAANRSALEAAGEASAVPGVGSGNIPQLPPNFIRATLFQLQGSADTVLVMQNTYGNVLDYQADITNSTGRSERTSICDVTAGQAVIEHWPWGVREIDLHDLNLLSTETAGLRDCE